MNGEERAKYVGLDSKLAIKLDYDEEKLEVKSHIPCSVPDLSSDWASDELDVDLGLYLWEQSLLQTESSRRRVITSYENTILYFSDYTFSGTGIWDNCLVDICLSPPEDISKTEICFKDD